MRLILALVVTLSLSLSATAWEPPDSSSTDRGDKLVRAYFLDQTTKLTNNTFADIQTLNDWTSQRDTYRNQLLEMLGLDPFPSRTPLHEAITGAIERDGVIAERIQFQSMPGLYVTANLYRPANQKGPLPAILYVCGHGGVRVDGVSLGNKTHYQHHGAWFAKNGYVCLTIDTIQLGEIEGLHHGTYREKMWWWNNRGYTPAGVEAWNCVRSLDYLQSRDEVDEKRIGVTGRSGGGAYSWWIAAIDDRVTAAVPVAGITSLHNHVIDGCVEGHCDCMFMVNTYRWDYPMIAALVAPRPLLISNSDKDRIFPLDGVVDVHRRVKKIYDLYDASDKLGLQITEGPHKDTQELRIHAFRWFNRFLREDDSLIKSAAEPIFDRADLRVFSDLPVDERVTTIHESFVPVTSETLPQTAEKATLLRQRLLPVIRQKCFGGWPETRDDLQVELVFEQRVGDATLQLIDFNSQAPYRLRLYLVTSPESDREAIQFNVLDQSDWESLMSAIAVVSPDYSNHRSPDQAAWRQILATAKGHPIAFFAPRGVGDSEWSRDERTRTHIRRRFMQLGQTAAGMRTFDVVRAAEALNQRVDHPTELTIRAKGNAATWALFAALFIDNVDSLEFHDLLPRNRNAPDLLNVSRIVEPPHVLLMLANENQNVRLHNDKTGQAAWKQHFETNPLAQSSIRWQSSEQHGDD